MPDGEWPGGSLNSCRGPCDHGLPPDMGGIMIIIGPWGGP